MTVLSKPASLPFLQSGRKMLAGQLRKSLGPGIALPYSAQKHQFRLQKSVLE